MQQETREVLWHPLFAVVDSEAKNVNPARPGSSSSSEFHMTVCCMSLQGRSALSVKCAGSVLCTVARHACDCTGVLCNEGNFSPEKSDSAGQGEVGCPALTHPRSAPFPEWGKLRSSALPFCFPPDLPYKDGSDKVCSNKLCYKELKLRWPLRCIYR
eukprot:2504634-Amphidinium_carterae.1